MTTTTTTTVEPFTPGDSSTPLGKGQGKKQKLEKGEKAAVKRFQRVKADEVSFSHDGLADNSFDARVSLALKNPAFYNLLLFLIFKTHSHTIDSSWSQYERLRSQSKSRFDCHSRRWVQKGEEQEEEGKLRRRRNHHAKPQHQV